MCDVILMRRQETLGTVIGLGADAEARCPGPSETVPFEAYDKEQQTITLQSLTSRMRQADFGVRVGLQNQEFEFSYSPSYFYLDILAEFQEAIAFGDLAGFSSVLQAHLEAGR
jgi:hypothetical protein